MENSIKKIVLLLLGIVCLALIGQSQTIEDELGFKYVKAKYLYETNRIEEAIDVFEQLVNTRENYEDANLWLAKASFQKKLYNDSKKYLIKHIAANGIEDSSIELLGAIDYHLDNVEASKSSLLVATASPYVNSKVYEYLGNIYHRQGEVIKACSFWEEGARLGSQECKNYALKKCGSTRVETNQKDGSYKDEILGENNPRGKIRKGNKEDVVIDIKTPTNTTNANKEEDNVLSDSTDAVVENNANNPPPDNTPNHIEIDEDLSIDIFGNSLGLRKVLHQPSIIIFSEEEGVLVIDVCVNKRGKVISTNHNIRKSTLINESLISMALRKSEEFWFEKNEYEQQCGSILFKING